MLLSSCATVSVVRPTPESAPLGERSLAPAERDAYGAVSASAGADGAEALYFLGLDRAAAGDWPSAAALWQSDMASHPATGWDRLATFKFAQSLEKAGAGGRAFTQYEALLSGTAVADLPERARRACLGLIAALPEPVLRPLAAAALPEFAGPIRIRLLELAFDAGRFDEVRQGVDGYLRDYPLGPGLDQVEDLSKKLEATVVVDRRALGLLVPLSGDMAAFGTQVWQGAKLAVDAFNAGRADPDKIRLLVADEGGDSAAAVAAATELIEKDHVIGLLGPLSSDSAEALLTLLAAHRTPMLSPAAVRPSLADASPWFFRDSLSPERQASAMADYAVVARRLTRVASLEPDDPYGGVSAQAFAARMRELGGVVAESVTYAPGTRDFRMAMLALGGLDPGIGKTADQDEMRDQQTKVEQACNVFGAPVRARVQELADPSDLSGTAKLRLMVVDFSQDTPCAALNAGRAFADRFARTLAQLDGVDVIGPQAALRYYNPLTPTVGASALTQVAQAGRVAGADFVLMGSAGSLPPDPARWPNRGVYSLMALLVDAQTATVCAQHGFTWTQYQAPPPNPLGLQAIYLPASAEDVTLAAPDMQFFDLALPLLGSDQWDRPELRDHLAELNGAVFTAAYWAGSPDPVVQRFDVDYRRIYAAKPGVLAAQAYDAACLMADALLTGGVSDRASLRAYLARVDAYDGAGGHFGFRGHQDAGKRPALVGVKDGALILLKEP